eukprot:CAMPEP_0175658948 /NCGR_PEP_ID=MMETSP0097-20121207/13683_1 /TAXON_ID=311494 /ORGANISM="Alexandrium monilatum, Strain CCMP3105" /LENGTH=342 /DNA_ID=CAMNT_0016965059 /DNA_START=37 /DNA_END=1063 /DNA_ORIENTATION=+
MPPEVTPTLEQVPPGVDADNLSVLGVCAVEQLLEAAGTRHVLRVLERRLQHPRAPHPRAGCHGRGPGGRASACSIGGARALEEGDRLAEPVHEQPLAAGKVVHALEADARPGVAEPPELLQPGGDVGQAVAGDGRGDARGGQGPQRREPGAVHLDARVEGHGEVRQRLPGLGVLAEEVLVHAAVEGDVDVAQVHPTPRRGQASAQLRAHQPEKDVIVGKRPSELLVHKVHVGQLKHSASGEVDAHLSARLEAQTEQPHGRQDGEGHTQGAGAGLQVAWREAAHVEVALPGGADVLELEVLVRQPQQLLDPLVRGVARAAGALRPPKQRRRALRPGAGPASRR